MFEFSVTVGEKIFYYCRRYRIKYYNVSISHYNFGIRNDKNAKITISCFIQSFNAQQPEEFIATVSLSIILAPFHGNVARSMTVGFTNGSAKLSRDDFEESFNFIVLLVGQRDDWALTLIHVRQSTTSRCFEIAINFTLDVCAITRSIKYTAAIKSIKNLFKDVDFNN